MLSSFTLSLTLQLLSSVTCQLTLQLIFIPQLTVQLLLDLRLDQWNFNCLACTHFYCLQRFHFSNEIPTNVTTYIPNDISAAFIFYSSPALISYSWNDNSTVFSHYVLNDISIAFISYASPYIFSLFLFLTFSSTNISPFSVYTSNPFRSVHKNLNWHYFLLGLPLQPTIQFITIWLKFQLISVLELKMTLQLLSAVSLHWYFNFTLCLHLY